MKRKLQVSLLHWYQASDQPLPAWLKRACEHDPRLAAERDAGQFLTSALKNDAQPGRIEPSPFLAMRIQRSLHTAPVGEKTRAVIPWPFAWVGGVVAAVSILAVAALMVHQRGRVPEAPQPTERLVTTGESTSPTTSPRSDLITTAVVDTTSAVMGSEGPWANPLRQELANVVADARGAVRFLASNFLPSEIADGAMTPADNARRPAG